MLQVSINFTHAVSVHRLRLAGSLERFEDVLFVSFFCGGKFAGQKTLRKLGWGKKQQQSAHP